MLGTGTDSLIVKHIPRVSAQLVAQHAVHGTTGHPRAKLEAHGPLGGERRAVPRPLRRPLPRERHELRRLLPLRQYLLPGRQHVHQRNGGGPRRQQRHLHNSG